MRAPTWVLVLALGLLAPGAAGCGAAVARVSTRSPATLPTPQVTASATTTAATTTAPPPSTSTTVPPTTTTSPPATTTTIAPGPGSLPQTDVLPSGASPQFLAEMKALWLGVETGSVADAMPALFPEAAYEQVKALGDPSGDWQYRLVAQFALDLGAAHAMVASEPGGDAAKLLYVSVPPAGSDWTRWIPPDYCYNQIGYWNVPGSRLVYEAGGQVRSFGIASLISWRGVWYVVHLGAEVRSSDQGIVDSPALGPGTFGYPGGC